MTARVTRIFLKRNNKRGIRPVFYCHVLSSLLLRSSTINVKNVGVRLWQSSAICLRAFARSAFLFTGSPRFARDDKGEKGDNFALSNHPARTTHATRRAGPGVGAPLQWRGTRYTPSRSKVPLCGGVARFARRGGHLSTL